MKSEIAITGLPDLVWMLRKELSRILLEAAEDEHPTVAARLRAIAAAFEAGQGVEM